MRKCPFCEAEVSDKFPYMDYSEGLGVWIFTHFCERQTEDITVSVTIYGKTKEEVIAKWNGVHEEQKSESV